MTPVEAELRDAGARRIAGTMTAHSRGLSTLDCEVLAIHAYDVARENGWRIVRTDPATGDCPIVIVDEWQPDTTPVPDVDPHVVTPIEEG